MKDFEKWRFNLLVCYFFYSWSNCRSFSRRPRLTEVDWRWGNLNPRHIHLRLTDGTNKLRPNDCSRNSNNTPMYSVSCKPSETRSLYFARDHFYSQQKPNQTRNAHLICQDSYVVPTYFIKICRETRFMDEQILACNFSPWNLQDVNSVHQNERGLTLHPSWYALALIKRLPHFSWEKLQSIQAFDF